MRARKFDYLPPTRRATFLGIGSNWRSWASELIASILLRDQVAAVQDSWAQIAAAPAVVVPIALAITIVPIVVGLVLEARQQKREPS
jgi:hypothetical protein